MAMHDTLKEARKRKGLSQELVAEELGISRQAVTKWEAGQSKPSAQNLQALAELYQVPVEELLGGGPEEEKLYNPILRANLIKIAIILHAGFMNACAQFMYEFRSADYPDKDFYRGLFLFSLVLLLLASIWMTSNHRYEPDMEQRRKNTKIELAYCCVQLLIALPTIPFGRGLVGIPLVLIVTLAYILYINPKFMNRKLTT